MTKKLLFGRESDGPEDAEKKAGVTTAFPLDMRLTDEAV